jgi:hypothetical protein
MTEMFRSKEILGRRDHGALAKAEEKLIAEEKRRLAGREDELRRLMKEALMAGSVFYRGNDRSPTDQDAEVNAFAGKLLRLAVPEVFNRFGETAHKVQDADLVAVLTAQNLNGLPQIFSNLKLIEDRNGHAAFRSDSGPLAQVFDLIQNRTSYGEPASGKYLAENLAKEPFGWEFDSVRLLAA